jgi:PAS domain S-box-containing protein
VNNKPTNIAFVLLLIFISGSVWLVFEYVYSIKQRDLDDWQARLSIMAESQQSAVESWFEEQRNNIEQLASNPLLQLYVSELASGGEEDETSRGQLGHLRNLINARADQAGVFTPIKNVKSNQANTINDGIAIVNQEGVMLATRYFPVESVEVSQAYQQVKQKGVSYITEIFELGVKQPRLIIAVPVTSVQSFDASDIRAVAIAVINPQESLYTLLLKNWVTTSTEETMLVSRDGENVRYLSPLKGGVELFYQQPVLSNGALSNAEAEVISHVGGFSMMPDYLRIPVLATARAVRGTSMYLVQKIDKREALAESSVHQKFILTVFLLAVFIVAISFIAVWRHATSLRLQKAKQRLEARAALLNAIGDSINDHIFLLDHNNKLVFINDALATSFSIDNTDIRGKALNHVFNNDITDRLLSIKPKAGEADVRNQEMRLQLKDRRHDFHVSIVGLTHTGYKQSYLYVMHDITQLKDAQGRHNRLMDGVISTLAQVIDKHDPHCANHSQRTREVSVEIARAMGMPQKRINALSMAALLANIGKLYIPAEMLTNLEPLTEEESKHLRKNIDYSVEILQGLEFDGPVIDFVQQKNECLDGSGYPKGLSGDEIYQESRILAVANAFVAMTSSRAYRSGKSIKEVLDIMISEADSRYDRHVIAALFHVAENHADWDSWQQVN